MKIKVYKKLKAFEGLLVVPVFKENIKNLPDFHPEIKEFIRKRSLFHIPEF